MTTPSSAALTDTLDVVDEHAWRLRETGWDSDRSVAVGSNFMNGNGYLGYRGTWPDQRADGYVALVVSDTYDCADGHWRELTTAPNPLFVEVNVNDVALVLADATDVETTFDLSAGEFTARRHHRVGDVEVLIEVERFASLDELHLLAQRVSITIDRPASIDVRAGIDHEPWSLNGVHLPTIERGVDGDLLTAHGITVESGIDVAVASRSSVSGLNGEADHSDEHGISARSFSNTPGSGTPASGTPATGTSTSTTVVVETLAAVASSSDGQAPLPNVAEIVNSAWSAGGVATARNATHAAWRKVWDEIDVTIEGSAVDQAALRFSTFHNRICTPAHTDHLPIGARGLSCQAYQGAAFWDQEVYNLPAFLYTEPDIARSLLVYRHKTLDGARRKAARLGYDGAYYAWISGTTGDELCPDVFFHDVLTGRPIRNHFNVWQMHVAPDVVTTVRDYVAVTGDIDFLVDHGAEIAFEVAKFLRSFVRYNDWKGTYHNIRLLGPDEWHENVDDNAFTNYQTAAALDFAISTYEQLEASHPDQLRALAERIELRPNDLDAWRTIRERLFLPAPDPQSKLIEQFDGFFELEDVTPEEVRSRLIDPSEYWGWPNGVAVRTQVSKQADVAMLLWLHADRFDDEVAAANYQHYEPRCSHNSSLSHAAYGMVAARLGNSDVALDHFRATATVDLLNTNHAVVAGTFIGGIHTAACAGTHQLAVNGIGGLGVDGDAVRVNPALPGEWTSLTYPVRWRGQRLTVKVEHGQVAVSASATNELPVELRVGAERSTLAPGDRWVAAY